MVAQQRSWPEIVLVYLSLEESKSMGTCRHMREVLTCAENQANIRRSDLKRLRFTDGKMRGRRQRYQRKYWKKLIKYISIGQKSFLLSLLLAGS